MDWPSKIWAHPTWYCYVTISSLIPPIFKTSIRIWIWIKLQDWSTFSGIFSLLFNVFNSQCQSMCPCRCHWTLASWGWSDLSSCLPCISNFLQIQSCEGMPICMTASNEEQSYIFGTIGILLSSWSIFLWQILYNSTIRSIFLEQGTGTNESNILNSRHSGSVPSK